MKRMSPTAGRIDLLKKVRDELGAPVGILLDTKGPEIRLGVFEKGSVELAAGAYFTLTTEDIKGTSERVSVTYKGLPDDVKPRDRILIDDGLIELRAEAVKGRGDRLQNR